MANTHSPEYAQWVLDEIVDDDDFREYYKQIDATYERFCAEQEAERELREAATQRELQVLAAALEDDEIVPILREAAEDAGERAVQAYWPWVNEVTDRHHQEILDIWNS